MDSKPWYKSRAMVAGYGAIGLWLVVFLYQLLSASATDVKAAAKDALEVLTLVSPVLGGLAILGIRGAQTTVLLVICGVLAFGCATDGTGARTDPQTGTTAVGAQTFSGKTQAGATYVIKSEGTTINIDTDGTPKSKVAAAAIAQAITKYDETIDALNLMLKDPELAVEAKVTVLESIKWITEEKRLYMAEAKGAFGVAITISSTGEGHGSSTVDTAGATGETGVPPTTEPDPDAGDGE